MYCGVCQFDIWRTPIVFGGFDKNFKSLLHLSENNELYLKAKNPKEHLQIMFRCCFTWM